MTTRAVVSAWGLALALLAPLCPAWAQGALGSQPRERLVGPLHPLTSNFMGADKVPMLKYLGDVGDDLTFTPVAPCRLVDTRVAGGLLPPRSARAFSATQPSLIAAAGGNPSGCAIPTGPSSLALTLTVVTPAQHGNLVAYIDGGSVPLASALNFLAGQIIANTTVVPSTSTLGFNFDIFNNSDGATDVVVDIVGYFYAPQAPDCLAVIQTASPASGASFSATAVCTTGYRITIGGCSTTAIVAGTDWQSATFNGTNDGWTCAGNNNTGSGATITSQANCCRNPGR
jgi:hypothetical protein